MDAVQTRVPNLGERVHALASFFMGSFLGFASLPVAWKAPSKDAFLAVGLMAFTLARGAHPEIDVSVDWQPDGYGTARMLFGGRLVAERKVPASPVLRKVSEMARRLQLEPRFVAGTLQLRVPGLADVQVTTAQSFTFPREPVVEITFALNVSSGGKPDAIVTQALTELAQLPVLVRPAPGKPLRFRGVAQIRADALGERVLAQALEALKRRAGSV
jgi:hypothetical protein